MESNLTGLLPEALLIDIPEIDVQHEEIFRRIEALPTRRVRKSRPQRATVMLIMARDGEIMLEKRPATGIWGGLWSFPEIDDVDSAGRICRVQFGVDVHTLGPMAPIEHGFTHFSLSIAPLLCRVTRCVTQAQMPGRAWMRPEEAMAYPIPVPVRKLLSQLLLS